MKATFITLLALAAGIACGETHTTTTPSTETTGVGNYYGWTVKLTDSFLSTTNASGDTVTLSSTDSVSLTSITISAVYSSGSGSLTDSGVKLAIYTYTSDGTVGTLVGLSDNAITATSSGDQTFTFTDVTLTAGQQYQFLFVSADTTVETLTATETTTTLEAYQAASGTLRINLYQQSSALPSGDGTYKNNAISSWEGSYIPDVTYVTTTVSYDASTESVPEPATATLSLLALAGLAARRRRK